MNPNINNLSSIIESIIMHFPSELVVKFIHRASIIDDNYNVNLTYSEYQKAYITKLYNNIESQYIMIKEHTNYIQMFNYNTINGDIIHTLIDNTNSIIHLNSDNQISIQNTIHSLCVQGFIPINITNQKAKGLKSIFNLKKYSMYYLSGGLIFKNSTN